MQLYRLLSYLPIFLLPTVSNPLPAIDKNAQLEFTELTTPSFAGQFDSQLPQNEGSTAQVDTNSNLNPLLFSVASENPDSQTEHFSQPSITKGLNLESDGTVCDHEHEIGHGSKKANKYRLRRNGAVCAVKEEDIDWDSLWKTFSQTRELTVGDPPACTNPAYPLHVCCRGPQSRYVHDPNLLRVVKNCAPCMLFPFSFDHAATRGLLIYTRL